MCIRDRWEQGRYKSREGKRDKVPMGRTMRQDQRETDPQRWDQKRSRKRNPGPRDIEKEMQTTERYMVRERE